MGVSAAELRDRYLDQVFDEYEVVAEPEQMAEYARACGEVEPRYTDPAHPDFQATTNYCARFLKTRLFPKDFPKFNFNKVVDAGRTVEVFVPIRAGDRITVRTMLHDFLEKSGRSGEMLIMMHRMEFHAADDTLLATVDMKLLIKGGVG